ncbi:unnamed protein product [Clonostachys rosea]|uniref:Heterokaryon incompatibility domain-containing protein n=1 Tax=Bionectria ochroleuca TaxID=29856 RepID=A0ABY6UJI8_BIOOC|nr:unnamed protein product [Clonostachys rosea]
MFEAHRNRREDAEISSSDVDLRTEYPWILVAAMRETPLVWWKQATPPRYHKLILTLSKHPLREDSQVESERITQEIVDFEICLAAAPSSQAYQLNLIGRRHFGSSRDSPEFYRALKGWLRTCSTNKSNHQLCCKSLSKLSELTPEDSPLPTRCLEITNDGVRLVETAEIRGTYLTLSHRWQPQTKTSSTTTSNYNARLGGEMGELSKMFQDAIAVTRGLGIKHLWIDSICIIQEGDDMADWGEESRKMGQYYQNSIATIFAVTGPDDDGFLAMKPLEMESMAQLPHFAPGLHATNRTPIGHFYAFRRSKKVENVFLDEVDQGELLSRGWVFQEHLLSRRSIYFTRHDTFVECASHPPKSISGDVIKLGDSAVSQRVGSRIFRPKTVRHRLNHSMKVDVMRRSGNSGKEGAFYGWIWIAYDNWYNLVMDYSCTRLTRNEDHLRAISGIATEVAAVLERASEDRYLSGLWWSDIRHGLLWRTRSPQAIGCSCGAPSWSWLAVSSPVQWPWRHNNTEPKLRIFSSWPRPSSTFDAMFMASVLQVRGVKLELVVKGPDDPPLDVEGRQCDQRFKTRIMRERTGDLVREPDRDLYMRVGPHSRPHTNPFYGVFSKSSPDVVAGWASLDEPQYYQGEGGEVFTGTVIACVVAARRNVRQSSMMQARTYDRASWHSFVNMIYDVLFLECVKGNHYRRIGMGNIYGRMLLEEFDAAEEEGFYLV